MQIIGRVQLTVEIDIGRWGEGHTIEELFKKSKTEALEKAVNLREHDFRVVGQPTVVAILIPEK